MVRYAKKPFPKNHYCINGDKFTDEYDTYKDTKHIGVSINNKMISAVRLVDGNFRDFECEKYKKFNVREKSKHILENPDNIMESTRIVNHHNYRGSFAFPLLWVQTAMYAIDNNVEGFFGTMNASSKSLISHYEKLVGFKIIILIKLFI